jgi:hypothetical protein
MRRSANSLRITDQGRVPSGTATARGLMALVVGMLLAAASGPAHAAPFPPLSAFVDQGIVLQAGPPGSWDVRLEGAISPTTAIKKGGTFFLYYVGADGNRSTDGGPRHRALGVATSTDGIHFTKYAGNPIITNLPHNNEEEGVFSAGATLDDSGNIVLYYGATTAADSTTTEVNCDVRVGVSSDGLTFSGLGIVVDHADTSVWDYGDELSPIGAFRAGGTWYVYYIGKGVAGLWLLGLASGPAYDSLTTTQSVMQGSTVVSAYGGGDPLSVEGGQFTMLNRKSGTDAATYVYQVSTSAPAAFNPPSTYNFTDLNHVTGLYDTASGTWFLYGQTWNDRNIIRVRTATTGIPDTVPPAAPTGVTVRP